MKKILIIDDDQVFTKLLGDILTAEKFSVAEASNGHDGLIAFEKEKPDLVVLDMRMPALDGIGFLKELREKNHNKTPVPVLIASNLSSIEQVSEGVSLGVKGYVAKSEETVEAIVSDIKEIISEEEKRKERAKKNEGKPANGEK